MKTYGATINELIRSATDRELVEAIMTLGAAYKSRVGARPPANNPAFPWARIGDEVFVYTSTPFEANSLEAFACRDDKTSFSLPPTDA